MEAVTISRHWHSPMISTMITNDLISLKIPLDDFVKAVEKEIGSVTWTFTKAAFNDQLEDAVKRVVEKVKEESAKVI